MNDAYERYREMERKQERKVIAAVVGLVAFGVAVIGGIALVLHLRAPAPIQIKEVQAVATPIVKPTSIRDAADALYAATDHVEDACMTINNKWNAWVSEFHPGSSDEVIKQMDEMLAGLVDDMEKSGVSARLRNERQHVKDLIHNATMAEKGSEVRDRLIRAYGIYGEMVKAALAPNGSFSTYHETTGRQSSDLRRLMSEIAVLLGNDGPAPAEPGPTK